MYKIIKLEEFKKKKQYEWFHTFSNPCYGFNVKMDVSEIVKYSKETKTSFFINTLYLITTALNSIEEMRIREVDGKIRLYDKINPTFTVMTIANVYENAGIKMVDDYKEFYDRCHRVVEDTKQMKIKQNEYNSNHDFDDYYMTCIPWLTIESMTHPLPDNNYESLSCPRVCWGKYEKIDDKYLMLLNITVNHCFVDGMPLANAFKKIQENFYDIRNICKL